MFQKKILVFIMVLLLVWGQEQVPDLDITPQQLEVVESFIGCKVWRLDKCLRCSDGYYFDEKSKCKMIDPHCMVFNGDLGMCEGCYDGLTLENGRCILNDQIQSFQGCRRFFNGQCVECSFRHYLDNGTCLQVSPLCRTWNEDGQCILCYGGYQQSEGQCTITNLISSNSLCATFDGQTCVGCAKRTYFNEGGICVEVSALCKTYDDFDGKCLSCYEGYDLDDDSVCRWSFENQYAPPYLGCKNYNEIQLICIDCSDGFQMIDGICELIGQFCTQRDEQHLCTECIVGYEVDEGECVWSPPQGIIPGINDPGCKVFQDNECIRCSHRFYFGSNGICRKVNDLCRRWNDDGSCSECYRGYQISGRICKKVIKIENVSSQTPQAPDLSSTNPLCLVFENGECTKCSFRSYFNEGICTQVDRNCRTYDQQTGDCLICFSGYVEANGTCMVSTLNQIPRYIGCKDYNRQDDVCEQCLQAYQKRGEVCYLSGDFCIKEDGKCVECIGGYEFDERGQCMWSLPEGIGLGVEDPGCKNSSGNLCHQCSFRYYKGDDGFCRKVNDLCKSWNNAQCLSCYAGYDLMEGRCKLIDLDPGCNTWNWTDFTCIKCSFRFYKEKDGVCTAVSDYCMGFDEIQGFCTSCYGGYVLRAGECPLADPLCMVQTEDGCQECYEGYQLANNTCFQIESNSTLFNSTLETTEENDTILESQNA